MTLESILRGRRSVRFLYALQQAFRTVARPFSFVLIFLLKPLKLFAWRTRVLWFRRIVIEVTTWADWVLAVANVQNEAMRLHFKVYRGNFIFGKALMQVDHAVAADEIALPALRGNRFMGIDLVSNDAMAFVTNAGPISTGQPTRTLIRGYIDQEIMTPRVRGLDPGSLREDCAAILKEWSEDPAMATMWQIRGAATRIFIQVLAQKTLPKTQVDDLTFHYARRFAELSLFGRYFPAMLAVLGTREGMRRDAYIPLRKMGIDNLVIDMTLFAAMFSVGTIVMKCVEFIQTHAVDYARLAPHEKMIFVIESIRLYPTVTTVHRIVENDETIRVCGREIALSPGDEVAYPFLCINQDPARFTAPAAFRLDRSREELGAVLSWSAGAHVCPAKDLSILVTVMMLDALAARFDLKQLRIASLEF